MKTIPVPVLRVVNPRDFTVAGMQFSGILQSRNLRSSCQFQARIFSYS